MSLWHRMKEYPCGSFCNYNIYNMRARFSGSRVCDAPHTSQAPNPWRLFRIQTDRWTLFQKDVWVQESWVYDQLSLTLPTCPLLFLTPTFLPLHFSSSLTSGNLSTGAGIHRHARINLEHQVPARIEEEDAEGAHLLWDAAWLRDARDDSHCSHNALDGGVVGRMHQLWRQTVKLLN